MQSSMLCKCKQLDSSPLESAKQSYKHCILRPAAMTPSQFDILLQRLIAMETPKDSWIFIQKQMSAYNNLPLGGWVACTPFAFQGGCLLGHLGLAPGYPKASSRISVSRVLCESRANRDLGQMVWLRHCCC